MKRRATSCTVARRFILSSLKRYPLPRDSTLVAHHEKVKCSVAAHCQWR
jgi:hypothetical protein